MTNINCIKKQKFKVKATENRSELVHHIHFYTILKSIYFSFSSVNSELIRETANFRDAFKKHDYAKTH